MVARREHIRPQQDDRFEGDPWEETIAAHLATCDRVRVTDIARNVLGIDGGKVGTGDQRRIAAVLKGLGWKPIRDWHGRGYIRGHVSPGQKKSRVLGGSPSRGRGP